MLIFYFPAMTRMEFYVMVIMSLESWTGNNTVILSRFLAYLWLIMESDLTVYTRKELQQQTDNNVSFLPCQSFSDVNKHS